MTVGSTITNVATFQAVSNFWGIGKSQTVGVCYRITGPWTETESAEVDHPDNPNSSKIASPYDRACHVRGRGLHWYIPITKKGWKTVRFSILHTNKIRFIPAD